MSTKSISLFLDTSKQHEARVALVIDGKRSEKSETSATMKAQIILPLIEEMLKEHEIALRDLTNIEVHTGPGSFTGIRVGITVANTLGTLLNIPINGKRVLEKPTY
jgi:tRNA threonylcarbamoyladenosine biosynthesis protein TsaB